MHDRTTVSSVSPSVLSSNSRNHVILNRRPLGNLLYLSSAGDNKPYSDAEPANDPILHQLRTAAAHHRRILGPGAPTSPPKKRERRNFEALRLTNCRSHVTSPTLTLLERVHWGSGSPCSDHAVHLLPPNCVQTSSETAPANSPIPSFPGIQEWVPPQCDLAPL